MNNTRPRHRLAALVAGALVSVAATLGCSAVTERVDDARDAVSSVTERARFCLSVVQAVTALDDQPSPQEAAAALEDVMKRAPDEIADLLAGLDDELRAAADGDFEALRDANVVETLRDVQQRTTEMCDPRG
ncbi:MAG: hypothetical protein WD576_01310 [Nitriliruptoraceae bacterium]